MEKIETTDSAGSKITYYKCHDNRYKEMMLNIMGRNINKYHRLNQGTLEKFEPKTA